MCCLSDARCVPEVLRVLVRHAMLVKNYKPNISDTAA